MGLLARTADALVLKRRLLVPTALLQVLLHAPLPTLRSARARSLNLHRCVPPSPPALAGTWQGLPVAVKTVVFSASQQSRRHALKEAAL